MAQVDKKHGHAQARQPLNKKEFGTLTQQFNELRERDLTKYTIEVYQTSYPDAKADLAIFDEAGTLAFEGRDFGSGRYYWPAKKAAAV